MDEAELAQKNQKVFQEKLLQEQEAFLEAQILDERERDRIEGDRAQERLREQAETQQILEQRIEQQEVEELEEQSNVNQQILAQQQEVEENQSIQAQQNQESPGTSSRKTIPAFPVVGFAIALTKDVFDFILTLTGVGIIIIGLYTVIYDVFAFNWALKRLDAVQAKKEAKSKFRSRLIRRMVTMISVSLVPILDALPEASITVWRNYTAEVALAKSKLR